MAKAELDILLSKLKGRLTGDSEFYVTNRHGKTVISNYPLHKNKKKLTANQRATFASFGECSKQAKAELSDPARLAYWQEQYAEYKKLANKNLNRANRRFEQEPQPRQPSFLRRELHRRCARKVLYHPPRLHHCPTAQRNRINKEHDQ